jgi:hypothetical protein
MVKVSITSHMRHGTVSIMEQDRGTGGYGEPWVWGISAVWGHTFPHDSPSHDLMRASQKYI